MTNSNGVDGYFAYSKEVTRGTREVPAIALPFASETMQDTGSRPLPDMGIIKGRLLPAGSQRTKANIAGQITVPMIADGIGGLLHAVLGDNTTTGLDPYAHEMTPGVPLPSFSAQLGWEDNAGTDYRKDYIGCLMNGLTLNVQNGQNPSFVFAVTARSEEADAYAAIVPAYGELSYFEFADLQVEVDGAGAACFDTFQLQFANNLYASPAICPTNPRATLYEEGGLRAITGTLGKDFEGWAAYNKFVGGTPATLVATFNAGAAAQLVIELAIKYNGQTPQMAGRDRIKDPKSFIVESPTDDATACTVTLTNGDATI
jgi:hypothetical protein